MEANATFIKNMYKNFNSRHRLRVARYFKDLQILPLDLVFLIIPYIQDNELLASIRAGLLRRISAEPMCDFISEILLNDTDTRAQMVTHICVQADGTGVIIQLISPEHIIATKKEVGTDFRAVTAKEHDSEQYLICGPRTKKSGPDRYVLMFSGCGGCFDECGNLWL